MQQSHGLFAIAKLLVDFHFDVVCLTKPSSVSLWTLVKSQHIVVTRRHALLLSDMGFYRAALYPTRSFWWQCRLSVRPSVTRVYCDKTNKSSANILIPYKRKINLLFRQKEWLVGDVPFYRNFGSNWPTQHQNASKTVIFNRYSLIAAQSLHLAFQWA